MLAAHVFFYSYKVAQILDIFFLLEKYSSKEHRFDHGFEKGHAKSFFLHFNTLHLFNVKVLDFFMRAVNWLEMKS
jgi:hypothetical protein